MPFDFLIPGQHPTLPGHFPGQPIIPAALLLDELSKTLEQHTGQHFCAAKQIRFIAPVLPSQVIRVEYNQKTPSDYRFTCKTGGQLVAKGIMSTIANKNTLPIIPNSTSTTPTDAADLYEDLPHQGDICLLDNIVHYDTQGINGVTKQPVNCPLQRNSCLPSWASLEYAAQALACHGLLNAKNNGKPETSLSKAWIIGVKYLNCLTEYLPLADNMPYNITAHIIAQQPGVASYEFSLGNDKSCFAFGRLNVAFEIAR